MGWLLSGVVSCGPLGREFPRDVDAVRDADTPVSCDLPKLPKLVKLIPGLYSTSVVYYSVCNHSQVVITDLKPQFDEI